MFLKLCSKFKRFSYIPIRLDHVQSDLSVNFLYDNFHKYRKLFPKPKYGGSNFVTLISGASKASLESTMYVKQILARVNTPIIFEEIVPFPGIDENGKHIHQMDELILSFERNRVALMTDYIQLDNFQQNERIRMAGSVRLYVSVAKFFQFPGFSSRGVNCDITVVGANVLISHTGLEYEPIKGMIETLIICNERSLTRFIEYAYNYANQNQHREIVFIHKFKYFKLSDGLFLDIANQYSRKYPNIRTSSMSINKLALHLILNPRKFDLICCNERYTNIIASILSGICGGPDLFSVNSFGKHHALFQPLSNRLSIPIGEDNDEMSPYGVISALVQLLLYMGFCETGTAVWNALIKTMIKDEIKTKHYCGTHSAADVYCRVLDYLKSFQVTHF